MDVFHIRQIWRPLACALFLLLPTVAWSQTAVSLYSKTFSGAGIPQQSWQYQYSPANASWTNECAVSCADTVWTDVSDPDSRTTHYAFSNRYDFSETQLKQTDFYVGAVGSALIRSKKNDYANPNIGVWPVRAKIAIYIRAGEA